MSFAVKEFLLRKFDVVQQLVDDLEACKSTDEKCSLVLEYIESFCAAIGHDQMWHSTALASNEAFP